MRYNSHRVSVGSTSGTKMPFPEINCRQIIQSLKMECQYLEKDQTCFQALNPKRGSVEGKSKLMHTQLRYLSRQQRQQEAKRSFTLCPGLQRKISDQELNGFPTRLLTFATTKQDSDPKKVLKSSENVKGLLPREVGNTGWKLTNKNHVTRKRKSRSTTKPFESLVRELRQILMRC